MSLPAVYITPACGDAERRVLDLIQGAREELSLYVSEPRRWSGSLRRMTFARAVQGSNSIEGYNASLDDVLAIAEDEPALDASEETRLALAGYRDAMTYVLRVAQDSGAPRVDEGLLKALHFMMIKHDLSKHPGQWRPGAIYVRKEDTQEIVYEGPDRDALPDLVVATLETLESSDAPVLVRAAMAHLNLVMVHPFSDGNGRMARALQTLVLAREQIVAPVFSSIEEYLGRNTQAYYDILAATGQGAWNPQHDARPWVRFCLTAHYRQVMTHLRRIKETERLWSTCETLAAQHRLPERVSAALYDAAFGLRLRNATYRKLVAETMGEDISELTATRDLKALVDAGLFEPMGERRGRRYVGTVVVRQLRHEARAERPPRITVDPFDLVSHDLQLTLEQA